MDEPTALARAYLSRVCEPADLAVWALVRACGPVEAAHRIAAADVPPAVASATAARRLSADPAADLDTAARHGIELIGPESERWPHFAMGALESAALTLLRPGRRPDGILPVPPLALWVKGPLVPTALATRSVAVVGSRAATAYGEHVTSMLGYGLARRDVTVVSGGAYGIDAVAHRSALAAEGPTVLVSAGGLDRPYPPGNRALFDRVGDEGLLVAETPPGSAPHRHRFLTRNRLIAAFGTGTVVVEAAARSGARNTASHCLALGRRLMVVPGPVTSAMSVGCHELLARDAGRAHLVTSVEDVLALVGSAGEGLPAPADPVPDVRAVLDDLDEIARRVFDGFPARSAAREDQLAQRSGVAPADVLRSLAALRLAGLIESDAEGHRIARAHRR